MDEQPKKCKSEMKAEQLARAKAWHDAQTNKAKGGAAAASSLSLSSSFYAGMTTTTTTPTQLSVVRPPLSTSQFATLMTTSRASIRLMWRACLAGST
jgi:hypothetical protein